MEEWKDIAGFEGLYQVSSEGSVRRISSGRVLKHSIAGKGYLYVKLGRNFRTTIHRLVSIAFIPNPEGKPTVNHIDRDKTNNKVDNLEWATYSEQSIHSPPPLGHLGHRNIYSNGKGFCVSIKRNRTIIFNKTFQTLPEAIEARNNYITP